MARQGLRAAHQPLIRRQSAVNYQLPDNYLLIKGMREAERRRSGLLLQATSYKLQATSYKLLVFPVRARPLQVKSYKVTRQKSQLTTYKLQVTGVRAPDHLKVFRLQVIS